MKIIAVDPGGTTGMAHWSDTAALPGLQWWEQIDRWQSAVDQILLRKPDVVVCESYHITARTLKLARSYDALYMIGALEHYAHLGHFKLDMQPPSARTFATPKKLERLGWRPTGDHATQATRHLVVWLFEHGMITVEELSGDS